MNRKKEKKTQRKPRPQNILKHEENNNNKNEKNCDMYHHYITC